ncbi:heme ABC transporter ATP-binding protein [Fontimonas sp. SYSU GA230001]|uniref:heme ABC transporter ATP-binding protein n=1 Tax=Fontimonas sp. SYSU GA230001 TaxID=3142450 RepID=UPI0032B4FB4C
MSLKACGLSHAAGGRALLRDVSLHVHSGEVHAVLGPNGAGKSTLLRLLSGELRAQAGTVECAGRALHAWSPRELARLRAVLPQRDQLGFGFTAAEVVHLGRLPCPDLPPEQERAIIDAALERTGAGHLRERRYTSLSGGERARVQLARVLAQIWNPVDLGPRTLLLDEPTASLDLAHQHRCLRIAREFAAQGVAVVVVLHDPNLAMSYADTATLLCCGETIAQGTPQAVLSPERLSRIYGVEVELLRATGASRPYIAVRP